MLKSALLYETQLKEKYIGIMHNPEYQYYFGNFGTQCIELSNNTYDCHEFVSVDESGNVLGFIRYDINVFSNSCQHFGLISFEFGNLTVIRDLYRAIHDIFFKYNFNRIQWLCFADNPHIRGYRNFIKRFGGRECGYLRQSNRLMDGQLHDAVLFEILKEDYIGGMGNKHLI